jgi:hypothetical protein
VNIRNKYERDLLNMGYDIAAYDGETYVASMEAPAYAFEKIKHNGYDWFFLIDAIECDGQVSGLGLEKKIKYKRIKHAYVVLTEKDKGDSFKISISGPFLDPMGVGKMMERTIQEHVNLSPMDKIMLQLKMQQGQNRQAQYIIEELKEFMQNCIEYCEDNGKLELKMVFS